MMNKIPTEVLIGEGQAKLLMRRLERGESQKGLAAQFGVSERRVRTMRAALVASEEAHEEAEEAPESAEAAPESVEEAPVEAEAAPEEVAVVGMNLPAGA